MRRSGGNGAVDKNSTRSIFARASVDPFQLGGTSLSVDTAHGRLLLSRTNRLHHERTVRDTAARHQMLTARTMSFPELPTVTTTFDSIG
jgi:hypothetical protein